MGTKQPRHEPSSPASCVVSSVLLLSGAASCVVTVFSSSLRKAQQYECKWYIPLADLAFHTIEDTESTAVPLVQEEEIDAMKFRISQIKNDIQREKVRALMMARRTISMQRLDHSSTKSSKMSGAVHRFSLSF